MKWKDGTPYAFQAWNQPVVDNVEAKRYRLLHKRTDYVFERLYSRIPRQQQSLQPDSQHHCTAAVKSLSLGSVWVKVPCDHSHDSVVFICEKKVNQNHIVPQSKTGPINMRIRTEWSARQQLYRFLDRMTHA